MDAIQQEELAQLAEDMGNLMQVCRQRIRSNAYEGMEEEVRKADSLNTLLTRLKRQELQRIQSHTGSIKVSMVYLTMIQEMQNLMTYTVNLLKVSRKFQTLR